MAPRGRPPKPRTSRMDAAIDAMKPYGFEKEVVVAKMRELLKEYEGQYLFIELDAYSVLLEALISDQDTKHDHQQNQLEVAPGETSSLKVIIEGKNVKDSQAIVPTDGFIDIPVCSSTTHAILPPPPPLPPPLPPPPPSLPPSLPPPPPSSPPPLPPPPPPPPVLDIVLPHPPLVLSTAFTPSENVHPRRRKPCHGWICDNDEELRFVILPSSLNGQISPPKSPPARLEKPHQRAQVELTSKRKTGSKRRSRWDLRPDDL